MSRYLIGFCVLAIAVAVGCGAVSSSTRSPDLTSLAPQATPSNAPAAKGLQTAVFAGGCFWGLEAVFEHVKGVTDVKSGYAGGEGKTAAYEKVSEGDTGHAESVKVTFDPSKVSYVQLLTVFFSVAHDPTQLNRQGPDTGTQYRSAIFYADDDQKKSAAAFIDAIDKAKVLSKPVVTEVTPLKTFYEAEAYHQNYLDRHPDEPYIVINDKPKVEDLKKRFPELYVEKQ
ncbi:MAG: peptide-methionine (S)-S-oxide reductase MsrA [Acidobacteriota bacterium]